MSDADRVHREMTNFQFEKDSISALDVQVRAYLKNGKFGDALDAVRQFVEFVVNDSRSTAKVFASADIDRLCRYIGEAVLPAADASPARSANGIGTVVLATELVKAGGHVELLKDIIRLQLFNGPLNIILTDILLRADDDIITEFSITHGVNVEVIQGSTTNERYLRLIDRLRSLAPATLVLLTYNQDSVGISAALSNVADKVVFIHHGDHHLSLGVTCEEFIHIDPSNIGYFHCKDELGIKNNRYWPLTVNCNSVESRVLPFLADGRLVTCTSGRPEKFDASHYLYDYIELIPRLLTVTGGRHIHIGSLTAGMENRLQRGFVAAGVDPACFTHVVWVPSIAKALVEYNVDIYISSFPLGGGKSCVEAMAAGIPLLMHHNYRSRFLGGADLAYPEAWIWRNEIELIAVLTNVTVETLTCHSLLSRSYYESFHSDRALIDAADISKDQNICIVPELRDYSNDSLQLFLNEIAESKALERSNLNEISRVSDEWLIAMREIEHLKDVCARISHERLVEMEETERLRNECVRVNNEWLIAMKEIARFKSEIERINCGH